jgi:hypothetical protein
MLLLLFTASAVFAQKTPNINIRASFNKENRTYYHSDKFDITVMADKDCYIKIMYTDVNNQTETIFPNNSDRDNFLLANQRRNVFETVQYYCYGPYGEETITVIASLKQFGNSEYASNDAETVRYKVTTVKPNEIYEYGKPPNMSEMIQAMRNDALCQGGVFEGNETSGYYIINGIRGSYRVLRETADTIQFAFYTLEKPTRGKDTDAQQRVTGYSFSFEKPGNIKQAIQTVRSGIESKGGTFTGNEQQGSFNAKGITGQYRVSELVYVTIMDKPVLIPNSMIEKEVKNYFGGR